MERSQCQSNVIENCGVSFVFIWFCLPIVKYYGEYVMLWDCFSSKCFEDFVGVCDNQLFEIQ